MATIQGTHDLHFVPLEPVRNSILTRWNQFKRSVGAWWHHSAATSFICCANAEAFDAYVADERIREDIQREMLRAVDYHGQSTSAEAAVVDIRSLGYEMATAVAEPTAIAVMVGDAPNKLSTPVSNCEVAVQRVCVVPRYAAAMTLVLRSRLGRMGPSAANQLLVEREYNRLSRLYGVREADIASHSLHVRNAYFGENVFERIPSARARQTRVGRWAYNIVDVPVEPPTVC